VDDALTSVSRAARYLVEAQHPDGSWGSEAADSVQFLIFSVETFKAFQVGANALAFMALAAVDETTERRAALERALEWLLTTRIPRRGNDWDVDCTWSALYGFQAMIAAAADPRFQGEAWAARVKERGEAFYALLEQNQEPHGGWGYYEGPVVSKRPTWATSFSTACVIPALVRAQELGWKVDPAVLARAVRYVERCRLPTGAFTYDLAPIPWVGGESINNVKGSLGRMQVCNWALSRAGSSATSAERIRAGLAAFFDDHKFLDVARTRPIPHEAYYANAAYFYLFGHCYAGQVINELPEEEREAWHERLREHLVKIQWADGSSLDFPNMSSMQIAGTSFSILALRAGLPGARLPL
jgi:squalene cyclase